MDADAGRRLTGHPKIPDGAPPGVIDLSRPSLLDWAEAVLPDSSVPDGSDPPRMATLGRGGPGNQALWVLVRFPPGWERAPLGWYPAEEQVVVLEGHLCVSDVEVAAPGWVCFPPRAPRFGSSSPDGALALARFSEAPRWVRGNPPEPPAALPAAGELGAVGEAGVLVRGVHTTLAVVGSASLSDVGTEDLEAVLSLSARWFALGSSAGGSSEGGPSAASLLGTPALSPWLCWVARAA